MSRDTSAEDQPDVELVYSTRDINENVERIACALEELVELLKKHDPDLGA